MMKSLYVIKDDLAGSFDFFGCFVNDSVAMRAFSMACAGDNIPVHDLSLYRLVVFNSETGEVDKDKFEFLMRGEKVEV